MFVYGVKRGRLRKGEGRAKTPLSLLEVVLVVSCVLSLIQVRGAGAVPPGHVFVLTRWVGWTVLDPPVHARTFENRTRMCEFEASVPGISESVYQPYGGPPAGRCRLPRLERLSSPRTSRPRAFLCGRSHPQAQPQASHAQASICFNS